MSDLTSQYIIAQEEHDYNKKYEEGTIVKHTIDNIVTAYTAKKNVPQFISILNENYWKKIASTEEGGTVDYDNLKNKPSINGVKLKGNITTKDLGIDNKFKGWYISSSALPSNPVLGDYAYVEDNGTTYIYRCTTDGEWPSASTEEKEPADVTFASSQEVNEVRIVNDLISGGTEDVLSAEQGKFLNLFVPKNLTEEQKTNVRVNIDAVKQEYQLVEHSDVYYTGENVTNGTKVESSVNKLRQYNVFDKANFKRGYRLNDSGEEVSDVTEGYVTTLIPAKGGCIVTSNCDIARFYLFDINSNFISRTGGGTSSSYPIKRINGTNNLGFITIQYKLSILDSVGIDNVMIAIAPYSTTGTIAVSQSYIPYSLEQGGIVEPNTILWKSGFSSFNISTPLSLNDYVTKSQIVNNLNSEDSQKPLSAAQGKILNDLVTQLSEDVSENDLKNPQNLSDVEKNIARNNIDAMKAQYNTVSYSGLHFTGSGNDNSHTDNNVKQISALNVLDKTSFVPNKYINGTTGEISDNSSYSYFEFMIPAKGGLILATNLQVEGLELYKPNGDFIKSDGYIFVGSTKRVRATPYDQELGFVRLQFSNTKLNNFAGGIDAIMVSVAPYSLTDEISVPETYHPFEIQTGGVVKDNSILWKDDFSSFNVYTDKQIGETNTTIQNEVLFVDINPWEPATADSGYSSPSTGWGGVTKREDWTATDKYSYYEFLEHYYDTYLGYYINGNYRVTKKGLWQDGAHTGHEIFEYDFCPINYKYTVMLSAGMNADETQGIWGLATFVRCLMNEEEPNMTIMKQNIRFKIIPIINASGFDLANLRYNYSNGVNPNWNFNYKDSWERNDATLAQKGDYPDSNIETQGLKRWINEYSGIAQLYVDMHTGRFQKNDDPIATNTTILDVRFGNKSPYYNEFNSIHAPLVKQFYLDKGFITSSDSIGEAKSVSESLDYQKHAYAVQVCGINSAMPEMHIESTGYGSDGLTNNSVEGIKGYVLQLRQIIMFVINRYITDTVQSANLVDIDILRFRK